MPKILDQYGKPIDTGALKEPQTSRITTLENQYLTPMLAGLTPSKLSATLKQADEGDLTAQHRLFSDMEERDAHLLNTKEMSAAFREAYPAAKRPLLIAGGPRFDESMADELGVDRVFARGTTPGEVASYLTEMIVTRRAERAKAGV